MSGTTLTPSRLDTSASLSTGVVLDGVTWRTYLTIANALSDQRGLRITFDRGQMELMTHSAAHEFAKRWLARLIETLAEEQKLVIVPGGNITFRREDLERGLEPDDCFWISRAAQMLNRSEWEPTRDPPPDLVLEIEISRSELDRMGIYASLGVSEVWRYNGKTLRIDVLQSGEYRQVPVSPLFPTAPAEELVKFLPPQMSADYLRAMRAFRE